MVNFVLLPCGEPPVVRPSSVHGQPETNIPTRTAVYIDAKNRALQGTASSPLKHIYPQATNLHGDEVDCSHCPG